MNLDRFFCKSCCTGKFKVFKISLTESFLQCDNADCLSYLDHTPAEVTIKNSISSGHSSNSSIKWSSNRSSRLHSPTYSRSSSRLQRPERRTELSGYHLDELLRRIDRKPLANDSLINKLLNSTPAKVKDNIIDFPFDEYNNPMKDVLCREQMSNRRNMHENDIKCNIPDGIHGHSSEPNAWYGNTMPRSLSLNSTPSTNDGLSGDGDLSQPSSINGTLYNGGVVQPSDNNLQPNNMRKLVGDNDLESPLGSVVSVDSGYNDEVTCSTAVSCHASTTTTTKSYALNLNDSNVNKNCSSSVQSNDTISNTFHPDSSTDYQESSYSSGMKNTELYSILELNLNNSFKKIIHKNTVKHDEVPKTRQSVPIPYTPVNRVKSKNTNNLVKFNKRMAEVKTKIERPSNYVKSSEIDMHQNRKATKPVGRPPKRHYSPRVKGEKRSRRSVKEYVEFKQEAEVNSDAPIRPGLAALLPPIQTFKSCYSERSSKQKKATHSYRHLAR